MSSLWRDVGELQLAMSQISEMKNPLMKMYCQIDLTGMNHLRILKEDGMETHSIACYLFAQAGGTATKVAPTVVFADIDVTNYAFARIMSSVGESPDGGTKAGWTRFTLSLVALPADPNKVSHIAIWGFHETFY
jgi:hypothetical protein